MNIVKIKEIFSKVSVDALKAHSTWFIELSLAIIVNVKDNF